MEDSTSSSSFSSSSSSYLRSKYTLAEKLGKGANGTVVKAFRKEDNHLLAIKFFQYHGSDDDSTDNISETEALSILRDHPNVIKLHEVFEEDHYLFLVFDYMDSDLRHAITSRKNAFTPFSEYEIRNICFQLLKGLEYIHSYGFMHRDLKPENILVSGYDVKIADFGSAAAIIPFAEYLDEVTTLWYSAPEVLPEVLPGDIYYGDAVDMWAFGAIMGELFRGAPLFCGIHEADQLNQICKTMGAPAKVDCPLTCELAGGEFPQYKGCNLADLMPTASKSAIDLIQSLLSWDADKRPTANQALNHPFFIPCFQPESFDSSWCAQGTTVTMTPMQVC